MSVGRLLRAKLVEPLVRAQGSPESIARGGALQGYAGGLDLKARLLAMEHALPKQVEEQARLF